MMSTMHALMILAAAVVAPTAAGAQTPPLAPTATEAPDPARLAAAEKAVAALVPKGIYMKMMRDKMPQIMDMMMSQMMGKTPGELGLPADGKTPADQTLGAAASSRDPHFEERLKISTRVMFEEMGTLFDAMEPRVRSGLARAFARKFTLQQLGDMNAFFATPSGSAFAGEYLMTFMDPELMQEMMGFMPEMMKAMPGIMKKVEAATAHLPPPTQPDPKTPEAKTPEAKTDE